jgi:hypothetical protein
MVFFRALLLLKKKKTRTILKDLIIVVYGPIVELAVALKIIPKIVATTTTISNTFQLSMKYLLPYATILITNSMENIIVKMILILSNVCIKPSD